VPLLVRVPQNERQYFRGLGITRRARPGRGGYLLQGLRAYGLGDDSGTGTDSYIDNAEDTGYSDTSGGVDWSSVDLSGNNSPPILPVNLGPATPVTPPVVITDNYGTSALTASLPAIAAPANTVLNAAGQAVPKPGYTVNAQGQVVPASGSLASLASIPSSYWLLGIGALVLVSVAGKKKRR
jgi:hypothetical protein